jgi:tetratricopeptide (TPR) repeat protein
VEEARKLYAQSLEIKRRIGNVKGEIVSLVNLAVLDYGAAKKKEARSTFENALKRAQAIAYAEGQAAILNLLAQVDLDEGNFPGAKRRWSEALALYQKLQMHPKVQMVTEQLALVSLIEQSQAAWKAHASLLQAGGVLITSVQPGSQAEKAGIAPGDILIRYGTTRLDKPATLQSLAKSTDAGKAVTLEALRGATKLVFRIHGGLLGVGVDDVPPKPVAPQP